MVPQGEKSDLILIIICISLIAVCMSSTGVIAENSKPNPEATNKFKILSESYSYDITEIRKLINAGADVNVINKFNATLLYMVSLYDKQEVVKLLLEANADVNMINKERWIPLYVASEKGHTEIVSLLLKANADVNLANKEGKTPLSIASEKGHTEILEMLKYALSNKDKEPQNIDNKNIIQERSDKNIDNTDNSIKKLKVDSQYASRTIYTIQTGSHTKKANAEEEFNSILQVLNKKELDYLRIEKIGKYHTVRFGKFENYATAEKFSQAIKLRLSSAIILKAYIKKERIIKLYTDSLTVKELGIKEKSISDPVPVKIKPRTTEKSDKKIKAEITTENNKNAEKHNSRGVTYSISGKHQEAIEAFKEAIKINPDYPKAYYNLGFALGKSGMHKEATEAYKQAIRINPNYYDAYLNLGAAYGNSGMYKEAVDAFKQAIRVNSKSAEAHYNLGFAYLLLNDKNSAVNEYEILKNLNSDLANKLLEKIN